MKIWAKTDGEVREGKYLVVRRDGTIPEWPHFVMGGYDPCVPAALLVYAAEARRRGYDEAFCASVEELAADFLLLSPTPRAVAVADPDAGPHRTDNPAVIEMMRGNGDLRDYKPRVETIRALSHALNYHSIDAKAGVPDWQLAELLYPEVEKWLAGTTDVQVFERMTQQEKDDLGSAPRANK